MWIRDLFAFLVGEDTDSAFDEENKDEIRSYRDQSDQILRMEQTAARLETSIRDYHSKPDAGTRDKMLGYATELRALDGKGFYAGLIEAANAIQRETPRNRAG